MKTFDFILFTLLIVLSTTNTTNAHIINVPDDQETIQGGIDASEDGDTVLVEPGKYFENINYDSKVITLASFFILTGDKAYIDSTIIDGNDSGLVVELRYMEDESPVLTGFTIQNGRVNGQAGGIWTQHTNPEINYCYIMNNYGGKYGGGILVQFSSAVFNHCEIMGNSAIDGGNGGGIFAHWSLLILNECNVSWNNSESGGGIFGWDADLFINNCVVQKNDTESHASAIYLGLDIDESRHIEIINSTIFNNTSAEGDVIYSGQFDEYPTILNTIIWGNTPNDIEGPIQIVYSDIEESGGELGETNIDIDPLFINPQIGNLNLQDDSPCIDAGDPESPEDPDGSRADMGAPHFTQRTIRDIDIEFDSLMFIDVQTGLSDTLQFSVRNFGIIPIHLDSLWIEPDNSPYEVINNGDSEIDPESELILQVVFLPEEEADFRATIMIASNDPVEEVVEIFLTGNALNVYYSDSQLPIQTVLSPIYPNPFNSTVTLNYSLSTSAHTSINIYDLSGRIVESLINRRISTGNHNITWTADDYPSGMYFVKMQAEEFSQIQKIILTR